MTLPAGRTPPAEAGPEVMTASVSAPLLPRRAELHALTGLRFFAALHVVLFHTHALIGDAQPAWLITLASGGHHAVSLFFVLSGFILHYTYQQSDWTRRGETRNYFVNRFARIYPVYLLSFLIDIPRATAFFLYTYDTATGLLKLSVSGLAYLTLTQTWVPRLASAWNAPGWSLSNEAVFYLLFPWILRRVLHLTLPQTLLALTLVTAGSSLGQWIPRLAIEATGVSPEIWTPFLGVFPPLRLFEFAFGVLLGHLFAASRKAPPGPAATAAAALASVFAITVILLVSSPFTLPDIRRHHGLLLPFYGVLIVSLTVAANPVARILSTRPIGFLGGASYAVYLVHMPLFTYFNLAAARMDWRPSPITFLAYVTLVVGLSALVFHYYEEPLRRLVRNRFTHRPSSAPTPPTPPVPPPDRSRSPQE